MKKFLVDAHCDTITRLMDENKELIKNDFHIDIEKLNSFDRPVQFFAIWLQKKYYGSALNQTIKYIDFYDRQINKYNSFINKAMTVEDIKKNREGGKISAILAIEGGESLEGNIDNLKFLYGLGVRAMTLTWNYTNAIGSGVGEENVSGFTNFGYEVVDNMNKMGMIIDVSHLSEKCFWEFNRANQGPYMASHSNAKGVCNHKRNLSDEQIKAIASKNGIIGVNLYNDFLSDKKTARVSDILLHIHYIINLVGTDHIGFGCDFDGIERTPDGISDISDLNTLIEKISKRYGESIAEKISSGNFIRFIKEVW